MKALHELVHSLTARRLPVALALGALALGAASCGASSGSTDDIASKPADEILSAVATALERLRSYHIEGTQVDEDGRSRMSGDVTASGSMRFSLVNGRARAQLVLAGQEMFMKANRAFWLRDARTRGRIVELLAGRWAKLPAAAAAKADDDFESLLPKELAHCITHAVGTVTKKGTRQYAGRPVVVLADKGDTPGGAPGDVYIAASGPALPLRVMQTGPSTPGDTDPRCGDDESTVIESDIRLSAFDEPVRITAPSGALDLTQLSGTAA